MNEPEVSTQAKKYEQLYERTLSDGRAEQIAAALEPHADGITHALEARGIQTPDDVVKFVSSNDDASLHNLVKQAGLTKEDLDAVFSGLHPKLSPSRVAMLGAAAGGVIATAAVPVAQLVKNGRTGWRSLMETAPKAGGVGVAVGALTGAAAVAIVNKKREYMKQAALAYFDKQDAAWTEKNLQGAGGNDISR